MSPEKHSPLATLLFVHAAGSRRYADAVRALDEKTLDGMVADLVETALEDPLLYASDAADLADRLLEHDEPFLWIVNRSEIPHNNLARELLNRSRRSLRTEPERAELAARLAHDLLESAPESDAIDQDLVTAAALHLAEALEVLGEPDNALFYLAYADGIEVCTAPRLRGELRLTAARVRHRRQEPLLAFEHLDAAIGDFIDAHDPPRLARAALLGASILYGMGALTDAQAFLERALPLVKPHPETLDLYIGLRHNLATYLLEDDQLDRAREILTDLAPLQFDAQIGYFAHHQWLLARLYEADGNHERALETYDALTDALRGVGAHQRAAQVLLDSAYLCLRADDHHRLHLALARLAETLHSADSPHSRHARKLLRRRRPPRARIAGLLDSLTRLLAQPRA